MLQPSSPLNILFVPLEAHGHVNPSIGLAETLRDRGHHIIFAITAAWEGKLSPLGFEERIYGKINTVRQGEFIKNHEEVLRTTPFKQISTYMKDVFTSFVRRVKENETEISVIVQQVRPDIIITDKFTCTPCLLTAGVPWVWCLWQNPISVNTENVPVMWTGLPNYDRTKWDVYDMEMNRSLGDLRQEFNSWIVEHGTPVLTKEVWPIFTNPSPYLNLYIYPEELDYNDLRPTPAKWFRCDAMVRESESDFQLPETLINKEGKLIFLSMGSFCSADVPLMKRLVEILAKSPHRFIVSKGPFGDEYELHDNMWGTPSVPQTKVLPLVDLVITHGGNNTVTETFYFGKPMIILPIFGDQFDNAQRIEEKNYGIKLDTYNVTEKQLLDAIECILNDSDLIQRIKKISAKMQTSNTTLEAAKLIEDLKTSKSN